MRDTISELIRAREQNRIIAPSTLVPDLDAAAGNAILQCLEPESTKRPASALALEQNARDFVQRLGYTERPVDRAYGFDWDLDYQKYAEQWENRSTYEARLSEGQPPLVYFWYRQSPTYFETKSIQNPVLEVDPPPDTPGMLSLRLDPQGRLIHFSHVSPNMETTSETPHAADSTTLFAAAGFDAGRFQSTEPQWNPGVTFDSRAAWIGSYDHGSDDSLRVEAAWLRSRLVSFQIFGPWSQPDLQQPPSRQRRTGIGWVVMISLVAFATLLSWRNLRMGRGDVTGATRLAIVVACVKMLIWVFTTHYVPTEHQFERIVDAIRWSSFYAIVLWALYVGLEPYVRRQWPQSMISWTRIINGRFRDPLVGAHLLIAVAFSLLVALVMLILRLTGQESQLIPPGAPNALSLLTLLGVPVMLGSFLQTLLDQAAFALALFLMFFAFKVALKRPWLAALMACAIDTASVARISSGAQMLLPALLAAVAIFLLVRFGVLIMTLAPTISWSILQTPLTTDLSAWYRGCRVFIVAVVLGLTAFSFHTALAGRPLIRTDFLESS